MNSPIISVIICTHNPRPEILRETLEALRAQSLPVDSWELLLIDNASRSPLADQFTEPWHPRFRVIREEEPGLTPARLRGTREAAAELLVFVDDDNLLGTDYLRHAREIFASHSDLGAAGGKSLPRYEAPPPPWFPPMGINLACRDYGSERITASWKNLRPAERLYPEKAAPIGAGMVIRRDAMRHYATQLAADPRRKALDRRGKSLVSGGDNDIVMTTLELGYTVSYEPGLSLHHIIPPGRLDEAYQARLAQECFTSWVAVLDLHGIRPWRPIAPWTAPLRKLRLYISSRAWQGGLVYLSWRAACGQIDGRARLR